MKTILTYEFDSYEESSDLEIVVHARDLYVANEEARERIRKQLKYGTEPMSDQIVLFLENLRESLYIGELHG